jgi:GT2 family glycosyltransferase
MDISFVIVNWNTRELLLSAIGSIYETVSGIEWEIWLVDNASTDGSVGAVRARYPEVRIIENTENKGFAAANNQAFRQMTGRYALLLNSDAELTPGAVARLYGFMESRSEVGMACGQLLNLDGSRQNAFASFPDFWSLVINESLLKRLFPQRYPSKYRTYGAPIPVDSCIGACMIVRKTAMDAVGLFDERYFFFMEETDWARQFRKAGWEIMFVPDARIYHAQGKSAGPGVAARILFYRSRYRYLKKWHPWQYPLMALCLVARLVINCLTNLLAVVFTLGFSESPRIRCRRYWGLLMWHLGGCRSDRR